MQLNLSGSQQSSSLHSEFDWSPPDLRFALYTPSSGPITFPTLSVVNPQLCSLPTVDCTATTTNLLNPQPCDRCGWRSSSPSRRSAP